MSQGGTDVRVRRVVGTVVCRRNPPKRVHSNTIGCYDSLKLQVGVGMPGTIHIVDDDPSFRRALERRLRKAGYEVVTYPSAQQMLDQLPDESGLGCILLDVRIPGLSGPELQIRLSELGSTLPIIFLTGYADVPTTVKAIKAGADDFLTKPVSAEQLISAIEHAVSRHESARHAGQKLNALRAQVDTLTPREHQVFELVVQGKINKQIAHQLGATERTIKAHRHKVMEKMGVQSLAELVSIAERMGVLRRFSGEGRQS
jgi:RNA polymerase sigma factor (sigma-70 family)